MSAVEQVLAEKQRLSERAAKDIAVLARALEMSNARAERWKQRTLAERARIAQIHELTRPSS